MYPKHPQRRGAQPRPLPAEMIDEPWLVIGYDHPQHGRTYSWPLPKSVAEDTLHQMSVYPFLLPTKDSTVIGTFPEGSPEFAEGDKAARAHPARATSPWKRSDKE